MKLGREYLLGLLNYTVLHVSLTAHMHKHQRIVCINIIYIYNFIIYIIYNNITNYIPGCIPCQPVPKICQDYLIDNY